MQLIYRAASYTFQPIAVSRPKATLTATCELLYLGRSYQYNRPIGQLLQTPKATNWRFAAPIAKAGMVLKTA
jgi:hypothetical protein